MSTVNLLCPVCAAHLPDDAVLQVHVNEHFAASDESFHATLANLSERDVLDQLVDSDVNDVDDDDEATIDTSLPAPSSQLLLASRRKQEDDDLALALALSVADTTLIRSDAEPWTVPSRLPHSGELICAVPTVVNVVSLCRAHAPAATGGASFVLCSDVDHFQSRWDRGWGCGWRNLQQFLSALSKRAEFARLLWHAGELGRVPTITDLQRALENAWALGYDRLGQQQLQTVFQTKRWVGTSEVVATLRSRGINARIAAFPRASGGEELARLCPGAVLRTSRSVHYGLVAWVVRYFRSRGCVERAWSGTPLHRPSTGGGGRGAAAPSRKRRGVFDGRGTAASAAASSSPSKAQQSRLEAFGFSGGPPARAAAASDGRQRDAHGVAEEQGVLATDPAALATASVTLAAPFVPPLYLQHQGHSRTIVGYEVKRDGSVNLLILDPSTQGLFEGVRTGDLRQLRRGEATLSKAQYEIVFLHATKPFLSTAAERDAAKTLSSDDVIE
jgi:hypothetical protein